MSDELVFEFFSFELSVFIDEFGVSTVDFTVAFRVYSQFFRSILESVFRVNVISRCYSENYDDIID
jgi:hypothetical protein